jgi:hypothetical protein
MMVRSGAFAQDRAACLASYDAGQAARDEKKLTKARTEFAVCASDACPAVLRRDCVEWLREADAVLPSLVLRAVDVEGRDKTAVEVDLDGAPWVHGLDGKSTSLDPGAHTLRFRAPGFEQAEERIVVAEAEKNRMLVVRLIPLKVAPGAADSRPNAPTRGTARARPSLVPPLIAGVVSVGLIGGAAYFYIKGIHDGNALRDRCGSPPTCSRDEVDAVHTKLVIGDVMAGIGVLAAATFAYLMLTRPSASSQTSAPVGLDTGGLTVRF